MADNQIPQPSSSEEPLHKRTPLLPSQDMSSKERTPTMMTPLPEISPPVYSMEKDGKIYKIVDGRLKRMGGKMHRRWLAKKVVATNQGQYCLNNYPQDENGVRLNDMGEEWLEVCDPNENLDWVVQANLVEDEASSSLTGDNMDTSC